MPRTVLPAALAAGILAACGEAPLPSPVLPSAPSPTPRPSPALAPEPMGEIVLLSARPRPGATLGIEECTDGPLTRVCTHDLRLEFSVVVDRDVPNARVTAFFLDGDRLCAFALSPTADMTRWTSASFVADTVSLSAERDVPDDPPSTFQLCPLPATTTRILAYLDQVEGGRVVGSHLLEEFDLIYTFAAP